MTQAVYSRNEFLGAPNHLLVPCFHPGFRAPMARLFWTAFWLRFGLWCCFNFYIMLGLARWISDDIPTYQRTGERIAAQYISGNIDWSQFIDEGWFQLFGIFFIVFGQWCVWAIVALNCCFSGLATVLMFRVGQVAFNNPRMGYAAAIVFACHPGAVFFQALPLKEGYAVFGILSILWGLAQINQLKSRRGWLWLVLGMFVLATIRIYLIPVAVVATLVSLLPVPVRSSFGYLGLILFYLATAFVLSVLIIDSFNIDISKYEMLQYFDIDRLNRTRNGLSRGDAAMFDVGKEGEFSSDWLQNAKLLTLGCFFFLVGVDISSLRSLRQVAVAPEFCLTVMCFPLLFRSVRTCIKRQFVKDRFPTVLFLTALMLVYGGATTNLGAMYRWRIQALPLMIILIMSAACEMRRGKVYHFVRRLSRRWKILDNDQALIPTRHRREMI